VASPALEVYLHGWLAGVLLRKDNGNLPFRYDKAYVEAKGPPLSLNLPLRTEAFSHRDCLAFFGNLLPEDPRQALRGEVPAGGRAGRPRSDELIGNCDAHGKNYSLLYDSPAPSLAPLYDLLSTAAYEELTKRLAMSIDGAIMLEDVDATAWQRLAEEAGVAPRFLEQRMDPFVARMFVAAESLAEQDRHSDLATEKIVAGIQRRAERFQAVGL
jgi:HipA-like protein